ncbi:MAG: hypothetical protein D8H92_04130 [Campylobacter sp.]|nr:MAG: hypothetical protein D8H92_04130 [Campylobacter sp.]
MLNLARQAARLAYVNFSLTRPNPSYFTAFATQKNLSAYGGKAVLSIRKRFSNYRSKFKFSFRIYIVFITKFRITI